MLYLYRGDIMKEIYEKSIQKIKEYNIKTKKEYNILAKKENLLNIESLQYISTKTFEEILKELAC